MYSNFPKPSLRFCTRSNIYLQQKQIYFIRHTYIYCSKAHHIIQNTEHPQLIFPDGKVYLQWANIYQN